MNRKKLLFLLPSGDNTSSGVGVATSRTMEVFKGIGCLPEILFLKTRKHNTISNIWASFNKHMLDVESRQLTNIEKQRLYIKIKSLKPDVIFIPSVLDSFYSVAIALKNKYNIPVISIPHGLLRATENRLRRQKKLNYIIQKMNKVDVTIFLTGDEYLHAKHLGFKGSRIILPNVYTKPAVLGKLKSSSDLLFIGRINTSKGIFELLKAWKNYIDKSNRQIFKRLVIRGHGNKKQLFVFRRMIHSYKLASRIDFSGYSDQYEIENLLRTSRALILPTKMEAQSLVVLEAWGHSLPVITTKYAGYNADKYKNTFIETEITVDSITKTLLEFDTIDDKVLDEKVHNGLHALYAFHSETAIKPYYKKLLEKVLKPLRPTQ